jgi:hypothetical protein
MSAIGLTDFERVRRAGLRTAVLRIALLLGAVALFALAFLESRGTGSEVGALLPAGTSPIVVLDISASISGPTNTRVYTTLRTLADSNGTAGLVVVSDTAYELLPPGSPTRELRALMRFFVPVGVKNGIPDYPPNPWQQTFQAGTRLSAGLDEARRTIVRAGVDKGSVILVSDLADAEDPSVLADSIANLRRANLAFRIVPLFPLGRDLALWTQLAGADAITAPATLPNDIKAARAQEAHPFRPGLPAGLLTLAAALVLLLAVNEQLCARLPIGRRARW